MDRAPLKATFEAFRKRDGMALAPAALTFVVIVLLLGAAFVAANWSGFGEIAAWYGGLINAMASGDTQAAVAAHPPGAYFRMIPSYMLLLLLTYIAFAAFEAACHRWMIRGERAGLFGLSLRSDTWSVYAGYWVWMFLAIGAVIAVGVTVGIVTAVAGAVGGEDGGAVAGIAALVACIGSLFAVLYFGVRLAPANAASVGLKRFAFFEAWKATKGRFWALLGSYLLLTALYIVGYAVLMALVFGTAVALNPAATADGFDVAKLFSGPQAMASMVAIGAGYAVFYAFALMFYVLFFGVSAKTIRLAIEEGDLTMDA